MKNRRSTRVLSILITALFTAQQAMFLSAGATNITGVANTPGGTGATYNINPTSIIKNTDIGYRKYENFNLSQGDIANLMYQYGTKDINSFVNLVDNRINIDGIVNTMRGNNFYNGRAIFVSPNGMVVGASGVLNVGSLGVYTPNVDTYNQIKNNPSANLSALKDLNNNKDGYVTINGKVLAAQDIDIVSGRIDVPGQMLAGTGNNIVINGRQKAEEVFNNIVNTSNITKANSLTNKNGVITLSSGIGTDISGLVANYGKGSTEINNIGHQGINISGEVANHNGDMKITNSNNDIYLASTGRLKNSNGTMKLVNTGNGIYIVDGSKIVNDNKLSMYNAGPEGIHMAGSIENKGDAEIYNTNNILSVSGDIKNEGNLTLTNDGTQLNVTGNIDNTKGLLKMVNNGKEGLHLVSTSKINSEGIELYNSGHDGLDMHGVINNNGDAYVRNTKTANGDYGLGVYGEFNNKNGNVVMLNDGAKGLNVYGKLNNTNGKTELLNYGKGGLNVSNNGSIKTEGLKMYNEGEVGLNVWGTVENKGDGEYTNMAGSLDVKEPGKMYNKGGNAKYYNKGVNGLVISGVVENEGTTTALNDNGYMSVGGTFSNNGNSTFENNGKQLNISGKVNNTNGLLTMTNNSDEGFYEVSTGQINADRAQLINNGKNGMDINGLVKVANDANILNNEKSTRGLNVNGRIEQGTANSSANGGYLNINNKGKEGLNVRGTINAKDEMYLTNTGVDGTYIDSKARISGDKNIMMNDTSKGGTRVHGLVNAKNSIYVNENGGNFVIGDKTKNDNYMTAGQNIKMTVKDGSILNYGVEKVLLNAGNNLTMDVTDGTIGLPVGQLACEGTGCVGIGPKEEGARDFTKSVNANVKGKVNAKTTDVAAKEKDLVINYAAIDSDMNIDTIKADGRVILTVDDDYGIDNEGTRYNMVNANTDPTKTNVEGWGISMISNGSIGKKVTDANGNEIIEPVTFIQTKADEGYGMDALANENIYLYENSFNDANYGRNKEIKTNKVCTMIAREGDLDVEFAGNTKIENITAEGDLSVVTRGKNIEIANLGHITDEAVIPEDYFGPRDYGQLDGGYMEPDFRDEALPDTAAVKALDINHNIRPTEELVDGGHEAWAGSSARVTNAVLDQGKLDVTADNVYANGIQAHFGREGYSKAADPTTNKVIGSDGIPTGHAVRPGDVTQTGRNELERNYYYHPGSGDGIFDGVPSHVDPDNGVIDATPLALEDPARNSDAPRITDDGRVAYIKQKDTYVESIDKRQYMRFNVANNTNPVTMEKSANIDRLLDVSRGGIAVRHNNTLKTGDVIPVHLTYGDLDIQAKAKVVSANSSRAGAEFIDLDQGISNQLLYLNMLLERNANQLAVAR